MKPSVVRSIASLGVAVALIACGDTAPTIPDSSPLAGLNETTSNDSATVSNPTTSGPGYFHGTVLGPSSPGAGNDSLSTAPRIAGVVVTIYERKQSGGADTVAVGNAKGSVTTGADGKFTLPTLPAGEYVVTFVPPSNSPYHGAYAFGPLRENSSDYPWWVVLAKK
jgi:hypothetical protein